MESERTSGLVPFVLFVSSIVLVVVLLRRSTAHPPPARGQWDDPAVSIEGSARLDDELRDLD